MLLACASQGVTPPVAVREGTGCFESVLFRARQEAVTQGSRAEWLSVYAIRVRAQRVYAIQRTDVSTGSAM